MKNLVFLAILNLITPMLAAQAPNRGWKLPPRETVERVEPLDWGVPAAAHLMRRAGFSAPLDEIYRVVNQGYEATLDELIDFEKVDDSALQSLLASKNYQLAYYAPDVDLSFANVLDMNRLWLTRMVHSRHQLVEKMTFFWHDHFSTSAEAVPLVDCITFRTDCPDGAPLLQIQNDTLRTHALGNFKEMVKAISRDPAMVVFLDAFTNVAGSPNENWARELLELFTMGEGNGYTEQDVQEAARAFTGWGLSPFNYRFSYNFLAHDHRYPKYFLGEEIQNTTAAVFFNQGNHDGDAVIDIIFRQPEVAQYITFKLWEFFVYPNPSKDVVAPLARIFRDSGYELKPLVRAIFEHPHFLSERAYRAKIKSPVELVVNAARELRIEDPQNLPPIMFFFSLGQLLYLPPNVGGWTSNSGWINTGTMLGRYNFTNFLTSNRGGLYSEFLEPAEDEIPVDQFIQEYQISNASEVVDFFLETLVQGDVSVDSRYTLEEYLNTADSGAKEGFDLDDPVAIDKKVRGLIYLAMLLPVYQLN